MSFGTLLNGLVCLIICLIGLAYTFLYASWLNRKGEKAYHSHSFQIWAVAFWTLAWAVNLTMYGKDFFGDANASIGSETHLMFSDLNSLFLAASAYMLSKGKAVVDDHGAKILLGVVLVGAAIGTMQLAFGALGHYAFPNSNGTPNTALLPSPFCRLFSVALSVAAPIYLGRAFLKRFGTRSVLGVACVYSLFQPIAYGIKFFPSNHRPVYVTFRQIDVIGTDTKRTDAKLPETWVDTRKTRPVQEETTESKLFIRRFDGSPQPIPYVDPGSAIYEIHSPHVHGEEVVKRILQHAQEPGYVSAWFGLRFSSVVFGVLGLLKLLLCGVFHQQIQFLAPNARDTVTEFHYPLESGRKQRSPLDEHHKTLFWTTAVIAAIAFAALLGVQFDLGFYAVAAAFGSIVAWIVSLTWNDILGKHRGQDGKARRDGEAKVSQNGEESSTTERVEEKGADNQ